MAAHGSIATEMACAIAAHRETLIAVIALPTHPSAVETPNVVHEFGWVSKSKQEIVAIITEIKVLSANDSGHVSPCPPLGDCLERVTASLKVNQLNLRQQRLAETLSLSDLQFYANEPQNWQDHYD